MDHGHTLLRADLYLTCRTHGLDKISSVHVEKLFHVYLIASLRGSLDNRSQKVDKYVVLLCYTIHIFEASLFKSFDQFNTWTILVECRLDMFIVCTYGH